MSTYMPRKRNVAPFCLYCEMRPIALEVSPEACAECLATEVDKSVRLLPTKRARCGHVSFNYFDCKECIDRKKEDRNEWWGIVKQIAAWDVASLSYNKPKRRGGDAWRSFPKLMHARGYTYNKRSGTYQVRFKTKHVGTARTAEEARAMYLKRVEEYRNELSAASNEGREVQESQVLQPLGKTLHDPS